MKNYSIDLGLAVLSAVAQPGDRLTAQEIAEVCECSHVRIGQIERGALAKLRTALEKRGVDADSVLREERSGEHAVVVLDDSPAGSAC